MTYASYDDMLKRYKVTDLIALSDKSDAQVIPENKVVDLGVINTALSDATAEINGYLTRYKLPLSIVSIELVRICCVIARYWLEESKNTDKSIEDYKICIKKLEDLRDGVSNLGLDDADLSPDLQGDVAIIEADKTVWGRKAAGGFI